MSTQVQLLILLRASLRSEGSALGCRTAAAWVRSLQEIALPPGSSLPRRLYSVPTLRTSVRALDTPTAIKSDVPAESEMVKHLGDYERSFLFLIIHF